MVFETEAEEEDEEGEEEEVRRKTAWSTCR